METYNFIKTSTAGNRTGFILGKKAFIKKKNVMKVLLRDKNLEAEQYAFLWKDGAGVCMEMAGGELCGGAILASPTLLGDRKGNLKINTVGYKLSGGMEFMTGKSWVNKAELPKNILKSKTKMEWDGVSGMRVIMDGIAYFISEAELPDLDAAKLMSLDQKMGTATLPAIGVVQILNESEIKPTIWVKVVNSLVTEQGCTTGSIAALVYTQKKVGIWRQPSGKKIEVIIKENIEIGAEVEVLSEGKVYLAY